MTICGINPYNKPCEAAKGARHRLEIQKVPGTFWKERSLAMTTVIIVNALMFSSPVWAGTAEVFLSPEPVRYVFVEGDAKKFSAHHWMNDHYAGGLRDVSLDYTNPEHRTNLSLGGRALVDTNDFEGLVALEKKDWGYVRFEYEEFRKYYPGTGGVYWPFNNLRVIELDKELALDIGNFKIETGLLLGDLPDVVFFYEREFKDGAKSRLTWTAVREGNVTRNIGPSWQDIEEIVDVFGLKVEDEIKGFVVKGEQRWEFARSEMTREEKNLATTGAAADNKIRVQNQEPEADLMTTTFGMERWFWNEKGFASSGYRFAHLDSREMEDIFEMNQNRGVVNFTNPKQVRNARADNDFDSHTWVASLMLNPMESVAVITKLKSEIIRRHGNSTYPQDTTPVSAGGSAPDGIINNTERSRNDSHLLRWGEGLSLRFGGIPRVALYNDLEFEQVRNWLSEDRQSLAGQSASNANEIFSRETISQMARGVWTLGARAAPVRFLDVTTQVRHRQNNTDYDDIRETDPGANTARSAFMDWQHIRTDEVSMRSSLKLWRKLQPAFRYQFRDDDYFTVTEGQNGVVETSFASHIYTFDLFFQITERLSSSASFSRQTAVVRTPAQFSASANTPAFHADVNTWLFNVDCLVTDDLSVFSTVQHSRANNFDDFTTTGLPLGADYDQVDLTAGLKWTPFGFLTVEPKYSLYRYRANHDVEYGSYTAHVIWLDFSLKWP